MKFRRLTRRDPLAVKVDAVGRESELIVRRRGDDSIRAVPGCSYLPPKGLRDNVETDADSDTLRSAPVCSWCGRPLAPHECERRGHVCDRCARLLREASLSDEEIYGDGDGDE